MPRAAEFSESLLKQFYFGPENVLAVRKHTSDRCLDLRLDSFLLCFEIDEWNHGFVNR